MPEIGLSKIKLTGWNPRKEFDPEELKDLKNSIEEFGILEPLIVRQMEKKDVKVDNFELVAGERRYRAAVELKLKKVPVVIKELSDQDIKQIMLIENLQRSSLAPLEEAIAIEALLQEKDITQKSLGKKLGKTQSWVANRLRLLQAPEELQSMIISQEITAKHVLTLLSYQEYPIYEEIMKSIKRHLDQYHDISVIRLQEKIDAVIESDNEDVLNLSDISYLYLNLQRGNFLDLKDCEKCKVPVAIKDDYHDQKQRYCLDRRCWKEKINQANQAYEKAKQANIKKLAKKGKIDTTSIDFESYKVLRYEDFDKTDCGSCEQNRLDQHDNEICMDPACYKKKKSANTRAINKAAREERTKTIEVLDKFLESKKVIDFQDIRKILTCLTKQLWAAPVKEALKPWGDTKEWDDIKKVVKSIPEEDLAKALYRLIMIQYLSSGTDELTRNKLKIILPEALK